MAQCLGQIQFKNLTEQSFLCLFHCLRHVDHIHALFFGLSMGLMIAVFLIKSYHALVLENRAQIPLRNCGEFLLNQTKPLRAISFILVLRQNRYCPNPACCLFVICIQSNKAQNLLAVFDKIIKTIGPLNQFPANPLTLLQIGVVLILIFLINGLKTRSLNSNNGL